MDLEKQFCCLQINCAKCLDHKHIAKLVDVVAHEGSLALAVSLYAPHLLIDLYVRRQSWREEN